MLRCGSLGNMQLSILDIVTLGVVMRNIIC